MAIVLFLAGVSGVHDSQHQGLGHPAHGHLTAMSLDLDAHGDDGLIAGHGHAHVHDQLHAIAAWIEPMQNLSATLRGQRIRPRNQVIPDSLPGEPEVPPVIRIRA